MYIIPSEKILRKSVDTLVETIAAKDALIAGLNSELSTTREQLAQLEQRIGDCATDLFEQMIKGRWRDDHDHDIGKNIKMVELKQIVEDILSVRSALKEKANA